MEAVKHNWEYSNYVILHESLCGASQSCLVIFLSAHTGHEQPTFTFALLCIFEVILLLINLIPRVFQPPRAAFAFLPSIFYQWADWGSFLRAAEFGGREGAFFALENFVMNEEKINFRNRYWYLKFLSCNKSVLPEKISWYDIRTSLKHIKDYICYNKEQLPSSVKSCTMMVSFSKEQ